MIDIYREMNCYSCGGFCHLVQNCRNQNSRLREKNRIWGNQNSSNNLKEKESKISQLSFCNKFYILANKVIQASILDKEEYKKDRKTILREEKAKKEEKKKY